MVTVWTSFRNFVDVGRNGELHLRNSRQYPILNSLKSRSFLKQILIVMKIIYHFSTISSDLIHQALTFGQRIFLAFSLVFLLIGSLQVGHARSCEAASGAITRSSFRSPNAETTFYYSVYTPPCYDTATSPYPVVYLMHGSNDDDGQWGRLGLQQVLDTSISNGTLPPMIVVMPFGEWLANKNQFDAVSWENVFLDELMPLVEGQYRIDARRESRAIGGISRGGFWAFEIAFRHPDFFSSVGGHSAFFAERQAPLDFDPLRLANNAPNLDTLRIELDRGSEDYAAPGLDLMHQRLDERGIPHTYTVYPEGQHNNAHWQLHVADYLAFYGAALAWTCSYLPWHSLACKVKSALSNCSPPALVSPIRNSPSIKPQLPPSKHMA